MCLPRGSAASVCIKVPAWMGRCFTVCKAEEATRRRRLMAWQHGVGHEDGSLAELRVCTLPHDVWPLCVCSGVVVMPC